MTYQNLVEKISWKVIGVEKVVVVGGVFGFEPTMGKPF